MSKRSLIRRLTADDGGATAIEYALIVGIMSLAVVAIAATGGALDGVYQKVSIIIDYLGGDGDG